MPAQVLNPTLYYRLRELYGRVEVARQGEPARVEVYKGRLAVTDNGESYRINCGFSAPLTCTRSSNALATPFAKPLFCRKH